MPKHEKKGGDDKAEKKRGADAAAMDIVRSPKRHKSDGTEGDAGGAAAPGEKESKSMTVAAAHSNGPTDSYGWEQMHQDFQDGKFCGVYGGANAAWHGLAEIRAGVDLSQFHKQRTKDELYVPALDRHLKNVRTRRRWNDICSFDPLGMYASPPTMASVYSNVVIPELRFEPDGKVVNPDGSAVVLKLAIDYVWDIPRLARRLNMNETRFRQALQKYCQNDRVIDPTTRLFLPPVGGVTVYIWGDVDLLSEESTEVAVRVHDSCCGSDVFGTDICTCRPYLVFAIKQCVEVAQRGGVGMVVYFQKEGRSLGEVTKFRVYNARKAQEGGDTADMYFKQTENVAGIRDARFQEVMPDVLLFLGIERIDWLLSMSSDKFEAIMGLRIQVMQRVALPDMYVPRNAHVEINAKVMSGYHSEGVSTESVVNNLRSLESIRARCNAVLDLAKEGKLRHLTLDLSKLEPCAKYVADQTRKTYGRDLNAIPYHSRWRHFQKGHVDALVANWPCDDTEKSRRLIDLVTVSVLLDAGAGPEYKFTDHDGTPYHRSEALAAASLEMFEEGCFSSDPRCVPHRVNSVGLHNLTMLQFEKGFQLSKVNTIVGASQRFTLLKRLAEVLEKKSNSEFFGAEVCRPGNLVDYMLRNAKDEKGVKTASVKVLWRGIIEGFEAVWPENLAGVRRGDVWLYGPLKRRGVSASDMIPFHKLSQWLTYSMLEPLERLGLRITDLHLLTGLAEYRNGGLFIDFGVLRPKSNVADLKVNDVGSELVVEWRACTIPLLDMLADRVRAMLGKTAEQLPLAKILQGGTWQSGRAIAMERRPPHGEPPIRVHLNGTVF